MYKVFMLLIIVLSSFSQERIISTSYSYTDMLLQLGLEKNLVAVDLSSLSLLPQSQSIGNSRRLSIEPILELNPSHVLMAASAGPASVKKQLSEQSNIKTLTFHDIISLEMYVKQLHEIARAFSKNEKATELSKQLKSDYKAQLDVVSKQVSKKRALFIYARGTSLLFAAGTKTIADDMMQYIGVENAVTSFEGFKSLTPEAVIAANPDIILMLQSGSESLGGLAGIFKLPGVAETVAGKNKAVVLVDNLHFLSLNSQTLAELKRLNKVVYE